MCGIAGIVGFGEILPSDKSVVESMISKIEHRGPDAVGTLINSNVALGHRRLSILDLSVLGNQPMTSSGQETVVVFNGEIYNFRDLKSELESDYAFRSNCDTEVILAAYQKWGRDFVNHLNGMFAIGLYDHNEKIFILVRDRLGIKPLFYRKEGTRFIFGSEIKSILPALKSTPNIQMEALGEFLGLNYCVAPRTLFEGVEQVLPGCGIEINHRGDLNHFRYWDLKNLNETKRLSEAEALEGLEHLLGASVRRRMISDVELGAFLSGGVDSSAVCLYAQHFMKDQRRLKTFSIGFEESSFNELPFAREVANHLGTDHFERIVKPDAVHVIEEIVMHSEEPTADSSMVPMYHLSKLAKEHVSVVLSGDGADEIFAGYETHTAFFLAQKYRLLPAVIRSLMSKGINSFPVSDKKLSLEQKLKRFVNAGSLPEWEAQYSWRGIFNPSQKSALLTSDAKAMMEEFVPSHIYRDHFEGMSAFSDLRKILYLDIAEYLPNDMLVKVDRTTMAFGLEARVPFLDHELVEYVWSLPDNYKLHGLWNKKFLLKKLVRKKLPPSVCSRKKAGFNLPVAQWLREELGNLAKSEILEGELMRQNIFKQSFVEQMFSRHQAKQQDFSHQLWGLLNLSIWYRQFFTDTSR